MTKRRDYLHITGVTQHLKSVPYTLYLFFVALCCVFIRQLIFCGAVKAEEKQNTFKILYKQGTEFYKAGNYSEAEKSFENALKEVPENKKAKKYIERIRKKKVESDKEKIIRDTPSSKDFAVAQSTGQAKDKKKTETFEKEYKEAETLFKKKKYDRSVKILKNLIEKGYNDEKVRDLLSVSKKKIEDKNKSEREEFLGKLYEKGNTFFKKGKYNKAKKILKQILDEESSYTAAKNLLSDVDKALAEESARQNKAIPSRKSAGKLCVQGENAFKKGSYKEALDLFMQALIADSENKKAKIYIKKCAEEIIRPRIEAINRQRQAMVSSAREIIFSRQKRFNLDKMYSDAVKYYKKEQYLRAGENFRRILEVTSDFRDMGKYFNLLESKMYKNSQQTASADAAVLSYAQGYIDWWEQEVRKATNEWEKYLAFNPRDKEVLEYLKKAKDILEMKAQKEYQQKVEEEMERFFKEGEGLYENKNYVSSIKKFEKVISICEEKPIESSSQWRLKARTKIEDALARLKEIALASQEKQEKIEIKEKEKVIDPVSAQKHYTAGLVAYAQGRLGEAIREWDLSLRLDPHHEKARLARDKAKKELGLEK